MSNLAIGLALGSSATGSTSSSNHAQMKAYCSNMIHNFDSKYATIQQKQEYAKCVNKIYPQMSFVDVIVIKIAIIIAFVCFIASMYKGWKESDMVLGFILGILTSILTPLLFVFSVYGVIFLFS